MSTPPQNGRPGFFSRFRRQDPAVAVDPAMVAAQQAAAEEEAARIAAEQAALAEEARKLDMRRAVIDTLVDRHMVTVSSLKGGVTKTTTTLGMGTAMAMYRRAPVLAIDANPHRGNLADRLGINPEYTARDLVHNAPNIRTDGHFRHFAVQARSRLEVIASESNPEDAQAFTADEYRQVVEIALTFRQLVITDTGIDLTLPLMREVYNITDTLVVPATTADDASQLAWETLDWWEAKGRGDLVKSAVVAITQIEPFTIPRDQNLQPEAVADLRYAFEMRQHQRQLELGQQFGARVGTVVFVPYDPVLRVGGQFDWNTLQQGTRDAYEWIAYSVASRFGARH